LTISILSFNTDVKALFIEIGSRFIIIELLKLTGNYTLLLEAVWNLALSVKALCAYKIVAQLEERLLSLFESTLLSLVELVFFLEFCRGLDLTWGCLCGDVEEIYICLQKALLHKLNGLGLGCNFLLKFKVVFLFSEVGSASRHVLFVLVKPVVQRFLSVFLDHLGFSLVQELILFLSLGFLLYLTDF